MPLSTITNPFLDPAGSARSNVYSPSANTIGIVTAGTERVRVDSSGNVLIGANSATVVYSGSSTVSSKVQSVSDYENFYATSINNNSNPAYNFAGKNSAGTVYRYAAIQAPFTTTTAGSEAGGIAFHTSLAGSNITERVRIDASGRVTIPNQPLFAGVNLSQGYGAGTTSATLYTAMTTILNVGSHWNGTRFTCPIAGVYQVHAHYMKDNSASTPCHLDVYVNGSLYSGGRIRASEGGTYDYASGTYYIQCAASDYIEYYYHGAGGMHSGHSAFSILLVR